MTKQIDITKVYSVKSSAVRAFKNAGSPEGYAITETNEGWGILPAGIKKPTKKEGSAKPRNGNCAAVWEIADKMEGARRKEVVAACVAKGIPEGTAKTQYQHWYVSKKG